MLDGRVKTLHPGGARRAAGAARPARAHGGDRRARHRADRPRRRQPVSVPADRVARRRHARGSHRADRHRRAEHAALRGEELRVGDDGGRSGGLPARARGASPRSDDDLDLRRRLAAKVFAHTAAYDAAIAAWFAGQRDERFPERICLPLERAQALRYGENPGQARGVLRRARGRRPRRARAEGRQGALVQQPARPRGRAAGDRAVRRSAVLRDHQAHHAVRARRRRPTRSRRTARRSRAIPCRRSAR